MFSSLACVASEKVTRLSRFFIVTPKEVLHFPFISSEKNKWQSSHSLYLYSERSSGNRAFFLYIFVHFSTLQHTDFIPFLMLHDRRFYSFFRAQRSNKKTIKTSKNLYKNDPINPTKTPVIFLYNPYTGHCNFNGLVQNFTHVCQWGVQNFTHLSYFSMIFRLFQAFLYTVVRSLSSSREAASNPLIDPLIDPKDAQ